MVTNEDTIAPVFVALFMMSESKHFLTLLIHVHSTPTDDRVKDEYRHDTIMVNNQQDQTNTPQHTILYCLPCC